jgi:hypothetical protein
VITLGRLRVTRVVERAGPTRPTWLLPAAGPEAVERHREWLAPHFLDDRGRFRQSLMHHPIQMAEPQWTTPFDSDPEAATKTRRAFCERDAGTPVTVLGTHFHHPTAGCIVRHGEGWRFVPGGEG